MRENDMDLNKMFEKARQNPKFYQEALHIEITERLYREMKRQGLNYSTLGRKIGMHRAAVQKCFASSNLTLETISRLAFGLGKYMLVRPVLHNVG